MRRLSLIAYLIALTWLGPATADTVDRSSRCAFLRSTMGPRIAPQGFRVVPGRLVPMYDWGSNYAHITRVEDASLIVQSTDDIDALALVLDQGEDSKDVGCVVKKSLAEAVAALPRAARIKRRLLELIGLRSMVKPIEVAIPLSNVLPEVVGEMTGKKGPNFGPNCWNATMKWHLPSMAIRPVESQEMEAYLAGSARKLAEGETLRIGDIIAVRDTSRDGYLLHTARYVDDQLVWEKASPAAPDPWTWQTTDRMLAPYTAGILDGRVELEFYRDHN